LRITRTGDTFSFYDKTNQTDTWTLETTLSRGDLHGIPVQVGIEDAAFSTSTPVTLFTDFELSGTNVVASVTRPQDATGLAAAITSSNAVTFSWTPGAGSAGSIVVVRKNNPLVLSEVPINGYTYNASTNFAAGDDLGAGIYVVYAGAASSATISGLGSIVDTNYVAVYSYTGSGSSIVYGENPATTITSGSEPIVGVSLGLFPTTIPVNGSAVAQVVVTYGDGSTSTNPVAGVTLASLNPAVAVVGNENVSGMAVGTAAITATYAGITGTNFVTVETPAFADGFGTPLNYLTNGLPGSTWDGLYLRPGDVPNSSYVGTAVNTTEFNADISGGDELSIAAANSGWQGSQDNGPFLFKNVPGDFEASVHITDYSIVAYEFVGLQARAYSTADGASPSGPGYTENFVDWLRFDEYGITTTTFNTENNANIETDVLDGESTDYWLLMSRVNGTNFYFYKKANLTDPWIFEPTETITRPDLAGVPLQVGVVQSTFTGNDGLVQFDSFSLDATNISGGVPPSPTTGLVTAYNPTNDVLTLTWTPGTNSNGSASTSFVVVREGAPVSAQPYFGILTTASSVFGQGTDLGGGNYLVYRGVGNTVSVTGLDPGAVYYAAVYGYSGSSTTKSFNEAGSASGSIQAGSFVGVTATLTGGIPLGGVGLPSIRGLLLGGGSVDVSSAATITSENTNVVVTDGGGVLTGLALGSATNLVSVQIGTNTFTASFVATVRPPSYANNFGVSQDFIADGVTNTTWDGLYAYPTFTIPGSTFVSASGADVFSADANVTSNNVLTVTSENVGWEYGQDDGFFLYKYVPGDFQTAVHINNFDGGYSGGSINPYNTPGLLARAYGVTNGVAGAPYNGASGESWVSFTRFDQYGIGTYCRYTLANATTRNTQSGGFGGAGTTSDTNLWLLIVRQSGTNFLFFQRESATQPWTPPPSGTTYSLAAFAGAPMQVGVEAGGFDSGVAVSDGFDSFMLDEPAAAPVITVSSAGGNITLKWPASGSVVLKYTTSLSPASWQPVAATPVTAGGTTTVTLPATNGTAFFRLFPSP
jgi:hypothetical protein